MKLFFFFLKFKHLDELIFFEKIKQERILTYYFIYYKCWIQKLFFMLLLVNYYFCVTVSNLLLLKIVFLYIKTRLVGLFGPFESDA